jgi:aminoglycoside phosphotransferase (APT) family kinase protein
MLEVAMNELGGRRLIAEGREAEIFEWDAQSVLRLQRDPADRAAMERGAVAMAAARGAGVPVPLVIDVVTVDGRPGLVMERVRGEDLFTDLSRHPWKLPSATRLLARLHAELHETPAPTTLTDMRDHALERIANTDLVSPRLAGAALQILEQLPDGDRLCHGDYHPGNVLVGRTGPVIIDWTNATRGDPAADIARSRLMFRLGDLPPGYPIAIRVLDRVGRRMFLNMYTSRYRRVRPFDSSLVDRWEIVRAADRFSEGIESEFPALTAFLEQATSLTA